MSRRILGSQSTFLNNTLSNFDDFYVPIGEKVNVYKFRMVSGSLYLTKFGELELNNNPEKYQQTFQIFTGKEPITVFWNNSVRLVGNKETNKITKYYQVGDYETCYLANNKTINRETTNKELYGKDYVMSILNYDIVLQSTTWNPNESDIRDYLYLILDPKSQSYKWLEIASVSPIYNPETNKFQYCEITFNNIANKYTQTGKSILDFVQMGAIGEGYAFPKETLTSEGEIKVELDQNYLDDYGANSVQLDFTCGTALSSIAIYGRRKSKKIINDDGTITYEVDTPHRLWLFDTLEPKMSKFFYNQPNLNSYIGMRFQPTKQGIWDSYKNAVKSNERIGEYNILNTKEVLTGLKHNINDVRNSNKDMNTYTNWNNSQNFPLYFTNEFQFETSNYWIPKQNFTVNLNYANFLNINSYTTDNVAVFNYDYRETKKWKLTDTLGIFGGLVNTIIGGLDIGWTTDTKLSNQNNNLNLIIPCISFEDGMLALNEQAPLPLDVFHDEKSKTVLPTSTNVLTSWRFRLTDRIYDSSNIRNNQPIGRGGNGIWDLKYVGQRKYDDGTWIYTNREPFKFDPSTTTAAYPSNSDFEFLVDVIDYKAIASCDCRITAYDNQGESVYYSISETNAKARGDIRIWENVIKFNYYNEMNTSGEIDYPERLANPKPASELTGFTDFNIDNSNKYMFDISFFNYGTWTKKAVIADGPYSSHTETYNCWDNKFINSSIWNHPNFYTKQDVNITHVNGTGCQFGYCGFVGDQVEVVDQWEFGTIPTYDENQEQVYNQYTNCLLSSTNNGNGWTITKEYGFDKTRIDKTRIRELQITYNDVSQLGYKTNKITLTPDSQGKIYKKIIPSSDNEIWLAHPDYFYWDGKVATVNFNGTQKKVKPVLDVFAKLAWIEYSLDVDKGKMVISYHYDAFNFNFAKKSFFENYSGLKWQTDLSQKYFENFYIKELRLQFKDIEN